MASDNEQATKPGVEPDPIADKSLSFPLLVLSGLLFLSLVWALYDELLAARPWKQYQQEFVSRYTNFLKKLGPQQAALEKQVLASPEFQKIEEQRKAAEAAVAPRVREIDAELQNIRAELAAIKMPFQDARARVAALTYELDHAGGEGAKNSIRRNIEKVKSGPFRVSLPGADGGPKPLTFDDLEQRFNDLKTRESQLNAERTRITAESRDLTRARNQFLADRMPGLGPQQIEGLLRKMDGFTVEIKQIHVEEAGLIDRCESCHAGIREPAVITAADMGGNQVFVSHPNKPLLALHDPERFGCTPCHNGNGLATSSATAAHGAYKHWLWPMFDKENSEAGCIQCHFTDRVLEQAPVLTRGRDLFELKGCIGCHRYEGFDRESDALANLRKETQGLEMRRQESRLEMDREIKRGDEASTNEEAQAHYALAENLRVSASNLDARLESLEQQAKFLMQDQKKVGPNLKDVRLKLRKEWIPVWLKDPQAFRPGTKMPTFRLTDAEIEALSAFVWQSGLEGPRPAPQPAGNAGRGKELFETRGCLACHSIGEGDSHLGGEFAANLSRLGEKASYDYIVRWVHDPRERTRPYCPHERRDLGPEDYARHGLPFVFGDDHSACPNDGHQLQVQNMTVMPSFRLTTEESRDIAAYLTGLKHNDASYPANAGYMDNRDLFEQGRTLAGRYGCGSCHEIQGLEDAPRIGTELTKEASKPMEQLDFGLLEHQAKKEGWYTHKGFFVRKIKSPSLFDQGREKPPEEQLRMPNIHVTEDDVRALTTLLVGSIDSPFFGKFRVIPEQFRYIPTDQQRDIQEGWWLIKKYNCMGCHNVQIGQKSVVSGLPRYQDPDWKEQVPPTLVQEGARVNPDWLTRFLANPALSERDANRNGVRTYLHIRMPTFHFSPNEIRTLVRFFEALAGQPSPHIPTRLEPLDDRERLMARALFSSKAAPCLKCHLVGNPSHDRFATAPNFLQAAERLKPGWTTRWMIDPQAISPGTAMPSGLFRQDGAHWVFAGPTPDIFKGYSRDHVQLLVRYMFQLTAEEQRQLIQQLPSTAEVRQEKPLVAMERSGP
ncbi:MAG: c-type cytochrome [Bryobacteraceae bacterium]|nr:c-type cytochrome [Bryobacteraceae bacterium]